MNPLEQIPQGQMPQKDQYPDDEVYNQLESNSSMIVVGIGAFLILAVFFISIPWYLFVTLPAYYGIGYLILLFLAIRKWANHKPKKKSPKK